MSTIESIEQALAAGHVGAAVAGARELLSSAPEKSGALLRELGAMLARVYRGLNTEAVAAFRDALAPELGAERMTFLLQPLQADLDLTRDWCGRLQAIASERLSNELLDRVKGNDQAGAEELVAAMLADAAPEARTQRARHIAVLLGGMLIEKPRTEALIRSLAKHPQKFGLDFMAATDVEEEFARSQAAAMKRERPAASTARAELTQAIVELSRALPQRMAISEPSEEQIDLFDRTVRAIFRCALESPGKSLLQEATLLLVEFSPKEVSTAGTLAGVEQRLYGTLGRTARVVATQVFRTLGTDRVVWPAYFAFAQRSLPTKIGRYSTEALGLLANTEAVPFLIQVLADRKSGARNEGIFALGSMPDIRAQSALVATLEQQLKGRVVEGEARRDAAAIISALGRGARALDNPLAKGQVAARVIRALPKDDTEFVVRAVLNFFVGKLEGMDPELLEWAARVGTSALWSIDRPELARAGRAAALGFRQPLIDLLGRLAPFAYNTINTTALEMAKTFSGAYLALGEFYFKYPDPRALPVLQQLLTNTFLYDDSAKQSAYVKEQVLDVATEQKQDLDKDKVLAALVFAVDKIGGEEGEGILANLYEQIQAGRLPNPGRETADILMQAHMKNLKARTGGVMPSPRSVGAGKAAVGGQEVDGAGASAAPATQINDDDLKSLSDLQASYLLSSKRRAKKVAALAQLGPRKVAAAIPTIIKHLTDSDPIIAAAAMTAVVDIGAPPVPAPVLNALHSELFQAMEAGEMNVRIKISDALSRIGPQRSPLKEKLEALRARPGVELPVRSMIDRLLGPASAPAGARTSGADGGGGDGEPAGSAAGKPQTALDKKREYMLKRQEWIRGGKRGPEPSPPE